MKQKIIQKSCISEEEEGEQRLPQQQQQQEAEQEANTDSSPAADAHNHDADVDDDGQRKQQQQTVNPYARSADEYSIRSRDATTEQANQIPDQDADSSGGNDMVQTSASDYVWLVRRRRKKNCFQSSRDTQLFFYGKNLQIKRNSANTATSTFFLTFMFFFATIFLFLWNREGEILLFCLPVMWFSDVHVNVCGEWHRTS